MEIEDWGAGFSEEELRGALTAAAQPPRRNVLGSIANAIQERRGRLAIEQLEQHRQMKRNREIDDEFAWLQKNTLFRGEAPYSGESWEDFSTRIAKKQRTANEARTTATYKKQRVTTGRRTVPVDEAMFNEVQLGISGDVYSGPVFPTQYDGRPLVYGPIEEIDEGDI